VVSTDDLQPGDLLFYATGPDPASINHVAMYIGHQQMIEAYDAATPVRITAVRFGPDYWGAERFLRPVAAQRSSPAKSPRSPVTWVDGTSGASMLRRDL
jgi:hypothetical protein